MKHATVLGIVALLIMAVLVMPVMADGHDHMVIDGDVEVVDGGHSLSIDDGGGALTIDGTIAVTGIPAPVVEVTVPVTIENPINVDVDNTFNPVNNVDVDNTNINKNTNINTNLNLNILDQDQKQQQQQKQTVNVVLPQDANGLLISDTKSPKTVSTAQLDVGEVQVYARLVYPGEVLVYPVKGGDSISMRSATDVGLYTVGRTMFDLYNLNSLESTPSYDPIYHKMVFGTVTPLDKINFWTTKATLVAGADATSVVIDNRAPRNGYTHMELTITAGRSVPAEVIPEPVKVVTRPDTYPTDEHGRAITS